MKIQKFATFESTSDQIKQFEFSLDYDGDIEYVEPITDNISEEECEELVDHIKQNGLNISEDRTEGSVTIHPDGTIEVEEKYYYAPENDAFDVRKFKIKR